MSRQRTGASGLWQVVKFTLFSASAGIIQVAVFTLMETVFHLPYWPSYLTALVLSVLWNFAFNRRYTFRSDAGVMRSMLLVDLVGPCPDHGGLERFSGAGGDHGGQFRNRIPLPALRGLSKPHRHQRRGAPGGRWGGGLRGDGAKTPRLEAHAVHRAVFGAAGASDLVCL